MCVPVHQSETLSLSHSLTLSLVPASQFPFLTFAHTLPYSGSGAGLSSFDALGRSTLNPLDALDKQISATRVEEEEEEDSVIEDGDVGTPESLVAIGAAELVFAAPPLVRLLPSAPPQSMARRSSEVARPLTRAESLSQLKVREENISNFYSIYFFN